ncbi:HTH domain-containing protein [Candidatus Haliotispira prima]|uniref:HTH domain-containing protein n=1 Tax=Candidatus Haliotispira prima TaxID=3034016 RepID=A0ABY8MLM7_9SPIO|nr:HTH domain-containing protein [Candidatus Haliotispira prima]
MTKKSKKTPSRLPTMSTGLTPDEAKMLNPEADITVALRDGGTTRTVEGYGHDGQEVTIRTQISNKAPDQGNGFRSPKTVKSKNLPTVQIPNLGHPSPEMPKSGNLSIGERRQEAKRLKNEGKLSQKAIAIKLGVSQKTVSNDLKS